MLKDVFTLGGRWGRLNRQRYLGYSVFSGVLVMIIALGLTFLLSAGVLNESLFMLLYVLVLAGLFWMNLCLASKRLHDVDKTAWLFLLLFVPLVGLLLALYLLFAKGTEGDNQYGPDPLKM